MNSIRFNDLTPNFIKFYNQAVNEKANPDRRWELWNEFYGFAAVPPTEEGKKKARQLLDEAWDKYHDIIDELRKGPNILPDPEHVLNQITNLFQADKDINLNLVLFVGGFEGNAFTGYLKNGEPAVYLPVEQEPEDRMIIMPHEFAHYIHFSIAQFATGWERSIGRVILEEGIAIHTTRLLVPNKRTEDYIEFTPGWLEQCQQKKDNILEGIKPFLKTKQSDIVYQFTMGHGTTGLEREAYYVGWLVVQHLLNEGHSIAELVRIKEEDTPDYTLNIINKILNLRSMS